MYHFVLLPVSVVCPVAGLMIVCLSAGIKPWGGAWFALSVAYAAYRSGWTVGIVTLACATIAYVLTVVMPALPLGDAIPQTLTSIAGMSIALGFASLHERERARVYTIRQLVDCIGGVAAVAYALGIESDEVAGWIGHDRIPPGWHYRLTVLAWRAGYRPSETLLGADCLKCPHQAECLVCTK